MRVTPDTISKLPHPLGPDEASFVDLKVVHRPDDSTSYLYVMKKEPEL